jgi:hypothetical protein
MATPIRGIAFAAAVSLILAPSSLALLAHRTDDVYVRQSDLIVVGDAVSIGAREGVPVAEVRVVSVILGSEVSPSIYVRNFPDGIEDMPHFQAGERSLLFLKADSRGNGVFWCVGAEAAKRDLRPGGGDDVRWADSLKRVTRLAAVRREPDEERRLALLLGLLDSQDLDLVAAASNYLNYLASGQEDEGWSINPPEDSSDWSWRDYFRRNAVAHRAKWQAWRHARRSSRR